MDRGTDSFPGHKRIWKIKYFVWQTRKPVLPVLGGFKRRSSEQAPNIQLTLVESSSSAARKVQPRSNPISGAWAGGSFTYSTRMKLRIIINCIHVIKGASSLDTEIGP